MSSGNVVVPELTLSMAALTAGGGKMAERIRSFNWANHPLGPPDGWPQSLRTLIRVMLTSRFQMWLGWGQDLFFFYNDAYTPTLGIKEPHALGTPFKTLWPEIWNDLQPRFQAVREGHATWDEGLQLLLRRSGYEEETYHTFSYSPVPDDHGGIGGLLSVVTEETDRIIGARRMDFLREFATELATITRETEVGEAFARCASRQAQDLPFALVYLFNHREQTAVLARAHGVSPGSDIAPASLGLHEPQTLWPAGRILRKNEPILIEDLALSSKTLPTGPWDKPPRLAVVVAIAQQGQAEPAGFLVAGLNPYRPFDLAYRGFVELLAGQLAAGFASARAYDAERKRAEALAELDRAKTTFFSNVSHELRTPLTLMLSPLEDILSQPAGAVSPAHRELASLAHRNGLRLLRLVNTLLDFSRIEAGRLEAAFEPVDVATLTAELASTFRSAIERAGLAFEVDCAPLSAPVHVDRQLWEKIVFNLLSNALKYTLAGCIRVSVREDPDTVQFAVSDTGTGISAEDQSHIFERFYRVSGAVGRTQEGTGIGLALVHDLVKLHGGTVQVVSEIGRGSAFTVTLPRRHDLSPQPSVLRPPETAPTPQGARLFLDEAARWLPDTLVPTSSPTNDTPAPTTPEPTGPRSHVLVVDDNPDMRGYIVRLLSAQFTVTSAPDGLAALEAVARTIPDLVVSDVMMPRLDGFGLLKALRENPASSTVPVILLSARAGEEARVEGVAHGADDYVVKPFSARELVARVSTHLELARTRREATARLQMSEERFRLATSAGNVGTWDWDIPGGRITWSEQTDRLFGLQPGEFDGKYRSFLSLVHPEDQARVANEIHHTIETGAPFAIETRIRRSDEGFRWFAAQGRVLPGADSKPARLIGALIDITGRKTAETERAALLAREQRARAQAELLVDRVNFSLSALNLGDWHWHMPTDTVRISLRTAEIYGLPVNVTMTREAMRRNLHPEDQVRARLAAAESVRTGTDYDIEYRIIHPTRGLRWVAAKGRPLFSAAGKMTGMMGVVQDITDRKQAELEVATARDAAIAASRAKDDFLAALSHELRNPLNPVLLIASEAVQNGGLPPAIREDFELIQRNIELEARLIDDLLDLTRITRGKLSLELHPTDSHAVLKETLTIVRPDSQAKSITLIADFAAMHARIQADPVRLQQIFWNVLRNAVKFTPAHGTVTITTSNPEAARVAIRITDTGIGMSPPEIARIFEAFAQGDHASATGSHRFGGLGLGLAISRTLVELQGGRISAASEGPGRGSTFTIELPLLADTPSPRASHPDLAVSV